MWVETVKAGQNNRWYNKNISKYLKGYPILKFGYAILMVFKAVFLKSRALLDMTTSVSLGEHVRAFRKILLPSFSS